MAFVGVMMAFVAVPTVIFGGTCGGYMLAAKKTVAEHQSQGQAAAVTLVPQEQPNGRAVICPHMCLNILINCFRKH